MREASNTQYSLTRYIIKLTNLCNSHPRRDPVLSHSPLQGVKVLWWTVRQCVMVKEPSQHCDGSEKWILSICHEWHWYWDHDVWQWGVTDIYCDGSDICILDWVAIRNNRYLPWWQWYLYSELSGKVRSHCRSCQNPLSECSWHLDIGITPSCELQALLIRDCVAMR